MTDAEIQDFIESMEELGDEWDEDQVRDAYGDDSLEEAIESRRAELDIFFNIIGTVLNR